MTWFELKMPSQYHFMCGEEIRHRKKEAINKYDFGEL